MKKYYINLTEQERSQIIHSLIDKKNVLMAQGRYTDVLDEVILKLIKAYQRRCLSNRAVCKKRRTKRSSIFQNNNRRFCRYAHALKSGIEKFKIV